ARGDALGELARVDEHQRRAVLVDESRDLPVNLVPLLVRADGFQRRRRDDDADVHLAPMADVHQVALAPDADEEPRDLAERLLRRGESDALKRPRERLEALERQ